MVNWELFGLTPRMVIQIHERWRPKGSRREKAKQRAARRQRMERYGMTALMRRIYGWKDRGETLTVTHIDHATRTVTLSNP